MGPRGLNPGLCIGSRDLAAETTGKCLSKCLVLCICSKLGTVKASGVGDRQGSLVCCSPWGQDTMGSVGYN